MLSWPGLIYSQLRFVRHNRFRNEKESLWKSFFNVESLFIYTLCLTLFWKEGGGQILPPPAVFFNTAQKPLGLGSWNFVTFSFNIQHTLSNSFWSPGTLGVAMTTLFVRGVWPKNAKNHYLMVFVSYCPKSSPKPLFWAQNKNPHPILNLCAKFELNRWEIKSYRKTSFSMERKGWIRFWN